MTPWCQSAPETPSHPTATKDVAYGLAVGQGGRTVYVTGRSARLGGTSDAVTVAYNATTGNHLWTRAYANAAGGDAYGYTVFERPQGDIVYVGGWEEEAAGFFVFVAAYNPITDRPIWIHHEPMVPIITERVFAGVSPDGTKVFAAISTPEPESAATWSDILVIAYDALTGRILWRETYDGIPNVASSDNPLALTVAHDSRTVYVAGYSQGYDGGSDIVTLAYDAATGALRFGKRLNTGNGSEAATTLGLSSDGGTLFVSGWSQETLTSSKDVVTLAYRASSGDDLWVRRYDGGGLNASAYAMAVDPRGELLVVSGHNEKTLHDYEFLALAYDVEPGDKQDPKWVARHHGNVGGRNRALNAVVSPDGERFMFAGCVKASTNFDYSVVALKRNGQEAWSQTYHAEGNPGDDTPWMEGLAMSPAGDRVYVAGRSDAGRNSTLLDYAVLAYDVDLGTPSWVTRTDFANCPEC